MKIEYHYLSKEELIECGFYVEMRYSELGMHDLCPPYYAMIPVVNKDQQFSRQSKRHPSLSLLNEEGLWEENGQVFYPTNGGDEKESSSPLSGQFGDFVFGGWVR